MLRDWAETGIWTSKVLALASKEDWDGQDWVA